jgi:uncharacterized membrane protein
VRLTGFSTEYRLNVVEVKMNPFRLFVVTVVSLVLWAVPSRAQNLTYTQIPDLCCSGNRANGINSNGDIVGHYFDNGGLRHGYFFGAGSAAPVPIDFSTAPFDTSRGTSARGINARGDIVGDYIDSAGVDHGYIITNRVFTSIDATALGAVNTVVHGLNDNGDIVGDYTDIAGKSHAFLCSKGVFQTVDFPLSSGFAQSSGRGIADNDTVVGEYADSNGLLHGFVRSPFGAFTSINDSAGLYTAARGINAEGNIVGSISNSKSSEQVLGSQGFLLGAGVFTNFVPIAFPASGVQGTQARGINPRGTITGAFVDSAGAYHGFIATQ